MKKDNNQEICPCAIVRSSDWVDCIMLSIQNFGMSCIYTQDTFEHPRKDFWVNCEVYKKNTFYLDLDKSIADIIRYNKFENLNE
jgi:hypothetical protein